MPIGWMRRATACFLFRAGPSRRYTARARIFVNRLEQWLTNRTHPLRQSRAELAGHTATVETIVPARR